MMDNLETNEQVTAEAATAEKKDETATALGKFKDVEALYSAYQNLEAEFTRRSTRLKELEKTLNVQGEAQALKDNKTEAPVQTASAQTCPDGQTMTREQLLKAACEDGEVRDAIIGQYIRSVADGKSVPLLTGGEKVIAARNLPKTLKDAGKMTLQFLKNQT